VTVHGAKMRKAEGIAGASDPLHGVSEPVPFPIDNGWSAIIDGVGGTGVVTIGAVLGMAAHLEGRGCGMIDMAGLAQKGGAVFSHLRIARSPDDIHAIRVSAGKADLVLGCDLVVSGAKKVLAAVRQNHTIFVANTAEIMPGDFARSADFSLPVERLKKAIREAAGDERAHFVDATRTAAALFGNSLGANMFMLGFAFQHGGLPLSSEAVEKAIELNGQAVAMNVAAFRWGRRAAHEPDFVRGLIAGQGAPAAAPIAQTLDEIVARRVDFLTAYQSRRYARRYERRVATMRQAETKALPGSTAVSEAVARNLFKLMAVKDEYEVARLYTDGRFKAELAGTFKGGKAKIWMSPPLIAPKGPDGKPKKIALGGWMIDLVFPVLIRMKGLRGGPLDIFGKTEERRMERGLIASYEAQLDRLLGGLTVERLPLAARIAAVPQAIRGFGHVKDASVKTAKADEAALWAEWDGMVKAAA
jgi:indolepyruvate ferredoxin oxidoreductase